MMENKKFLITRETPPILPTHKLLNIIKELVAASLITLLCITLLVVYYILSHRHTHTPVILTNHDCLFCIRTGFH